jgi:hypothetical protein
MKEERRLIDHLFFSRNTGEQRANWPPNEAAAATTILPGKIISKALTFPPLETASLSNDRRHVPLAEAAAP